MIRAGFARCVITPKPGLLMGGYRLRRSGALGTHDDLYATCGVFEQGDRVIALFALDLLCLTHEVVASLKAGIHAKTHIALEHILIACTHTHSGPSTMGLSGAREENEAYLSALPEQIASLVLDAQAAMRDCRVSILQTEVPDVAFNRRLILSDGTSAINIDKIDPQDVVAKGVTDPQVTAIFFEVEGLPNGILLNFTLHPTILGEENLLYSRDYPGYLVDFLNNQLDGQPMVLFFNGAFGDINQIKTPGKWDSSFQEARRIGEWIAHHVFSRQSERILLESPTLGCHRREISIPRRMESSVYRPDLANLVSSAGEKHTSRVGGRHLSPEKEKLFQLEATRLEGSPHEIAELQIINLGEVEIVALPGEIFVEIGLEVKRRSNYTYPLIFGNTNGYIGYVPRESSFAEGGYETRLSLTSRLVPEAEKIILKVVEQLREIR